MLEITADEIYTVTNTLETKFPEALLIVAGDFNQVNLMQVMPKYHQHISCPIRGPNILDHCYTTIKVAYHSIPRPHFRQSDHGAVFLLPACKQKLKREDPSQCWSEAVEDRLRDSLESVGWTVFKCSAENLNKYATTVTDFISKCVEDCVPKKSIQCWMNQEIHSLLKIRQSPHLLQEDHNHPVPMKAHAVCLTDYRPVVLTSTIMKCFERLVVANINSSLPACLDPLQFAYLRNRSTEDAIPLALHSSLEHLDNKDTYVRLLHIEGRAVVNTIISSRLISKLCNLGLSSALCNWILSFLTHRPQSVGIVKKAQQHLFFLWRLRKFGMSILTITNLYRCTIESIQFRCIKAWQKIQKPEHMHQQVQEQ
eukprot:g32854.t1